MRMPRSDRPDGQKRSCRGPAHTALQPPERPEARTRVHVSPSPAPPAWRPAGASLPGPAEAGSAGHEAEPEVKHHLCARLVKKVPLFQHCDLNFLNAVIMHLNIELFQPREVIIVEGSYGDRMYFLEYGRVLVESKSMTKELKAGDYFGEIFLFKECARSMTVTALTTCHLFSLSGDELKELLEAYPELGEEIIKCAIHNWESLIELEVMQQKKT